MKRLIAAALALVACSTWAAAPSIESASSTDTNESNSNSQSVTLPATISAGSTLACFGTVDGSGTVTWPGGWTEVLEQSSGGVVTLAAGCKGSAVGDEDGTSITVSTGASEKSMWRCYSVTGTNNACPEVEYATDFDDAPDPPELTPTGGSSDYLFFAIAAINTQVPTVSGFPSGYSSTGDVQGATSGTDTLAYGVKAATSTSSDNPSAFAVETDYSWVAATFSLGIPGSAAVVYDASTYFLDGTITATATSFGSTLLSITDQTGGDVITANPGATSSSATFTVCSLADLTPAGDCNNVALGVARTWRITDGSDTADDSFSILCNSPDICGTLDCSGTNCEGDSLVNLGSLDAQTNDQYLCRFTSGAGVCTSDTLRCATSASPTVVACRIFDESDTDTWLAEQSISLEAPSSAMLSEDSEQVLVQACEDGTYRVECP